MAITRLLAIEEISHRRPDIASADVKFHCDVCPRVKSCKYAFDLYNSYTDDERIIDTGCIMEK